MASSINSYPYPSSEIDVWDFVHDSLSGNNYEQWRQQMYDLINKQDLLGFIDGTTKAPKKETENQKYISWKRSDDLLKKWIRTTLTEDICQEVKLVRTAKGLWTRLQKWFGNKPTITSMASSSSSNSSSAVVDTVAEYPNPVSKFVKKSLSVSGNNYSEWRQQMYGLIKSEGLVGFVNGTIETPAERVTAAGGGDDNIVKEIENEDYNSWKRSDAQLREWIRTTLAKDIPKEVVASRTAKGMWTKLEKIFGHYILLHKAAIQDDWEKANEFIQQEPDIAIRAGITVDSETMLIVAVKSNEGNNFVKKLLELMSSEDLALGDTKNRTALHRAAEKGNIEAAKLLVNKNPYLPNAQNYDKRIPLFFAAAHGHRKMVLYLLSVTIDESKPKSTSYLSRFLSHSLSSCNHLLSYSQIQKLLEDGTRKGIAEHNWNPTPFEGESGFRILHQLTISGLYDIALALLQDKPQLACFIPEKEKDLHDFHSLMAIARKPSSFQSGTSFFQNLIYSVPQIAVPQIIQEKKLTRHQALEFVKLLCMVVAKSNFSAAPRIFTPVLFEATSFGIHEIIEEILVSYPPAIFLENPKKQSIFQYAVVCRRENVFNHVYQLKNSWMFLSRQDRLGNNGLHLAGCLTPQQQLNLKVSAAGAVLQMQRELKWFKEVEKISLPADKEVRNIDGMTPAEVFTDTHKELVKEGERWMKETTNSFTIVAALIGTVVFAAAITVPGGNKNESGHPIFSKQNAFIIFAISDALALFSSIVFVVMFLSILTSRYAEQDFLYSLPNRLIIGLITLFISILFTMIAFGAILYLVFGDNKTWIRIPIVALASLPLILFVYLQFPLFVEMVRSTYGPGIFGKQSGRMLL